MARLTDLEYFRWRAATERRSATQSIDLRVARCHLQLAEGYDGLISDAIAEASLPPDTGDLHGWHDLAESRQANS